MNPERQHAVTVTRRHFFEEAGVSVGKIALAALLGEAMAPEAFRARALAASPVPTDPLLPRPPHFAPKAKRVIHLFMAGAPSQLDLFDFKPELARLEGKPLPPSVIGGQRYAFIRPDAAVLGPRFPFARHGQCGAELSVMLPHLAEVVDEICIIKSVKTDQFNHAPAQIFFNTGFSQPGRPSLGSWVLYGLGSEAHDLPAFIVMSTGSGISGGAANWSSGFLPTVYNGHPPAESGRPDPRRLQPAGHRPPAPARLARSDRFAEPSTAPERGRSRDRHPHRRLRDGVPAPDLRPGADGPS